MASTTVLIDDAGRVLGDPSTQKLPASLDDTLTGLRETLDSVSSNSAFQERLMATLAELERSLASVRLLADTLNEQQNSLLFSRRSSVDPVPPEGSR